MRRVHGTYCGWHDSYDCDGGRSGGRVYLTRYIHKIKDDDQMEFHETEACEIGVMEIMFVNTEALVEEFNLANVKDRLVDLGPAF